MRIFIDWMDAALTVQGRDTGHLIRFRSELASGSALLAASHSVSPALCGREIFVEVEQQSIRDVRLLSPEGSHEFRLVPLPEPGVYEAIGAVVGEVLEEGNGWATVDVRVGDALFHWISDDIDEGIFAPGNWVHFTVVGLVLWDMNL